MFFFDKSLTFSEKSILYNVYTDKILTKLILLVIFFILFIYY